MSQLVGRIFQSPFNGEQVPQVNGMPCFRADLDDHVTDFRQAVELARWFDDHLVAGKTEDSPAHGDVSRGQHTHDVNQMDTVFIETLVGNKINDLPGIAGNFRAVDRVKIGQLIGKAFRVIQQLRIRTLV